MNYRNPHSFSQPSAGRTLFKPELEVSHTPAATETPLRLEGTSVAMPARQVGATGTSLAARARTEDAQIKLEAFRAGRALSEADRERFDGVRSTVDHAYNRWRTASEDVDLPAFDDDVANRIIELTEHGYTGNRLETLEQKGKKLDEWADATVGAAKSTPFAIASALTDLVPALSGGALVTDTFTKGYIVGSISAIFDTAGGEALSRAIHDAYWLRINKADQTPSLSYDPEANKVHIVHHQGEMSTAMQKAVENLDAEIGLGTKVGQAALSFQTSYTARNLARTLISPLASLVLSEATVSKIDTGVTAVGGMMAGAGAYLGLGHFAHKNGIADFSALLSRRDFIDRLDQLEKTSLNHQAKNALVRASKVPIDIMTDGTSALQAVFALENLVAEAVPLAGGIASIFITKTKLATSLALQNYSTASRLALTQLGGAVVMLPVLGLWPAASIITNHYKKPAADIIHKRFHQQPVGVSGSGVVDFGAGELSGPRAKGAMPRTAMKQQRRDAVALPPQLNRRSFELLPREEV